MKGFGSYRNCLQVLPHPENQVKNFDNSQIDILLKLNHKMNIYIRKINLHS